MLDDHLIGDTRHAQRLLETASPPTFYLPLADIDQSALAPVPDGSFCEWKGRACYWDVVAGDRRAEGAAWGYPDADGAYAAINDHVAFYPARLVCTVGGERVRPQPSGFYGGWVTDDLAGPFKGEPGTGSW